jgi:acyl carrier protein|tara:strand:- start:353 stop:463 length:111 start_codon:yes stop_codon:yes gene_type:complete
VITASVTAPLDIDSIAVVSLAVDIGRGIGIRLDART